MRITYTEKKIGFFRQFEIDDKNLLIKGNSFFGPKIDMVVHLGVLKPMPDTIVYKKARYVTVTGAAVIIFILFLATWFNFFCVSCYDVLGFRLSTIFSLVYIIYFFIYIGTLLITRKKIEYKAFSNKDEIIIFDIGKFGKYAKEFEEFVQSIIKKIQDSTI